MNLKFPKMRLAMPMIVILILLSFLINAQVKSRDVIYLTNGSIIKGDIIAVIPNETITIKTSDGGTFVYKTEEVERTGTEEQVMNEMTDGGTEVDRSSEVEQPKGSGYLFIVRFGPNGHIASNSSTDFSLGIINALQVSEYTSFGIGAEATTFSYDKEYNSSVIIFPFFFDFRFYIPKTPVQPMFGMQLGYSIVGNKKVGEVPNSGHGYYDFVPDTGKGGPFIGLNGGFKIQVLQRMAVMVEGGISVQKLHGKEGYFSNLTKIKEIPSIRGTIGLCWNFRSSNKK